jgi:hypothetical protein
MVGYLANQVITSDSDAKMMVKMIHEATLADNWKNEQDILLHEKPALLPKYVVSLYSMGKDDMALEELAEKNTMHKLLKQSDDVNQKVQEYIAQQPEVQSFDKFFESSVGFVDKYDDINATEYPLQERTQSDHASFNFLSLSLFTHMGIVIPDKGKDIKNKYCLVPACQPKFNNRDIPADEWLWSDPPVGRNLLIHAIEGDAEVSWTSQACFVIPYQVQRNTNKPGETPLKCALERSATKSKTETGPVDVFDGNLVATTASYDEAVKAFNAIAVRK